MKDNESITRTREKGTFERLYVRKGKKRKQRTERHKEMKKNKAKVTLCWIGEFEVYVYPYDYPHKVFIGKYPISGEITNYKQVLITMNKARWYIQGEWQKEVFSTKEAKSLGMACKRAYNYRLNQERRKEKRD